jgi:hypothetical protein
LAASLEKTPPRCCVPPSDLFVFSSDFCMFAVFLAF